MLRNALFAVVALGSLGACASRGAAVRDTASSSLGCPSQSIKVHRTDGHIWLAEGCGSSVEVACYDPQESLGSQKGYLDPATAGKRVRCETLLDRRPALTSAPAAPVLLTGGAGFDRPLAAKLLGASAERARACARPGGPGGPGHARVTFANDGLVTNVDVEPPFRDTEVGQCVARELARTTLLAFVGGPITVRKAFDVAAEGATPAPGVNEL